MNIVCKFSFQTMTVSTGLPFLPALSEDKESVKWKQNKHIFVHIDKYMVIFIKELSFSPLWHTDCQTGQEVPELHWTGLGMKQEELLQTRNVWNFFVLKGPVLHMTFRGQLYSHLQNSSDNSTPCFKNLGRLLSSQKPHYYCTFVFLLLVFFSTAFLVFAWIKLTKNKNKTNNNNKF